MRNKENSREFSLVSRSAFFGWVNSLLLVRSLSADGSPSAFFMCVCTSPSQSTTWREISWCGCFLAWWPLSAQLFTAPQRHLHYLFSTARPVSLMTLLRLSWFLPDVSLSLLCCPSVPELLICSFWHTAGWIFFLAAEPLWAILLPLII